MAVIGVVEDEALVREWISDVLRERGHEPQPYGNLSRAAEAFWAERPDLLLVDLGLPDGSGLDLIADMRALAPDLPIIVVSGLVSEEQLLKAYEVGASDYLTKPVSRAELVAKTSQALLERRTSGPADLPGGQESAFGRFRIGRPLGEGGSGEVFEAEDLAGGMSVALKVLDTSFCPRDEARQRFLREAYCLARVRHAGVAGILHYGSAEGRPYIAMELVHGRTLRQVLREEGPLSPEDAAELLLRLAEALEALGEAGIVHRDLKPENVVLRGDRLSDPVIVDFGLAKHEADQSLTEGGAVQGTPRYLAPEAIQGCLVDARADLFALGLIAVAAVTGADPYAELKGFPLLRALSERPVPLPAHIPTPLRRILARLTRLDPEARFPSAAALVAALRGGDLAPVHERSLPTARPAAAAPVRWSPREPQEELETVFSLRFPA